MDYPGELAKAYDSFQLGRAFKKAGEQLELNKPVELLPLYGRLTSRVANQSTGLTLASSIDYENYKPFINSGFKHLDEIYGGIPADGPIVIYGLTETGKSHFAAMMVKSMLIEHKEWKGAVYTLEMSAEHWMWREINMYPALDKLKDRFYVSGSVKGIEEIIAEVSIKGVNFVVIDDMDGLAKEQSASEYARVAGKIKELCRFLKIPVFILAQPNRAAKLAGKFLGRYDIAWSGSMEDMAALQIALQKANELEFEAEDETFQTYPEDHYYIIIWKSREGWPCQQGPGAIILKPSTKMWEGDPVKPLLWRPGTKVKTIGKKKRRE
jgi:hypothetical protein